MDLFKNEVLDSLIIDLLERGVVNSVGFAIENEELIAFVVSDDGEHTANNIDQLIGMLKAIDQLAGPVREDVDAEELEEALNENRESVASPRRTQLKPRIDYDNPLHEALRMTVEGYGIFEEINLGPLVRNLRTLEHMEQERTGDYTLRAEDWIERFESTGIARVEKRHSNEGGYDYSVLILNEMHDLVQSTRSELEIYPQVTQ